MTMIKDRLTINGQNSNNNNNNDNNNNYNSNNNNNKTWMKQKKSRFNSKYQSLRAFGGHRLHYQVHINTKLILSCLQELINNLLIYKQRIQQQQIKAIKVL